MPRMRQNTKEKDEINAKQQTLRDINAFMQMVGEERKEEGAVSSLEKRSDSAPPESPKINMHNPDGIFDVITFCEHPYFLNLRLTPWQKLILKIFYCGTPGNIHLKIDNKKTDTCEGCIWVNCKSAELRAVDDIKARKMTPYSYMPPENSRCLQCIRYADELRQTKFNHLKKASLNEAQQEILEPLFHKELLDKFETEKDLFENDLDDNIREQIRGKIGLPFQELILVLGRRSGKAVSLDTPIITPDGWKTMGELQVGDYVFGNDGLPTKIIATSDVMTDRECYEMEFSNGDKIIADGEHSWKTLTKAQRKNAGRGVHSKTPIPQIFTTKQIEETLLSGKPRIVKDKTDKTKTRINQEYNHAIEVTKPLVYEKQELPIPAHLLSCWIGDGTSCRSEITGIDMELFDYIEEQGYKCSHSKITASKHSVGKNKDGIYFVNQLRELNLINNKHIPDIYLHSSIEDRLELLRGLLDTDGYCDPIKHTVEFCSCNETIAMQTYELICGLGIKATIKKSEAKLYGRVTSMRYRIAFMPPVGVPVFKLKRKLECQVSKNKSDTSRIFIKKITKLDTPVPVKCIQVNNESNMYLVGKSMIPTHNSFLVSVIALYEIYKLLMMVHPQSRYALMEFDTITLLNVATSETVAKSAIFNKIRNLVETSPYLIQYIAKPPTSLDIWFLTPHDKEENARREKMGTPLLEGTIELRSGHSQSATMLGGTICTVIIDEMAAMAKGGSDGEGLDEELYAMLKPSLATFGMDGKMVCISNPLGPFGKFYKLYQGAFVDKSTLMVQLATWQCNPTVDQLFLTSQQIKDPENYGMHYGAQFGVTGASPFIPEWAVQSAFEKGFNKKRLEQGYPHIHYFAHLDPAFSSDNYTLAIVHLETMPNTLTPEGKEMKEVIVDHLHVWRPKKGFPIDANEVDSYIIELATKFHFAQISFDHWGSVGSINKLQNYGLNVVKVAFSRNYQNLIFQEMYELFINERIEIYDTNSLITLNGELMSLEESSECRQQLLTLQKKWRSNSTYKVEALRGSKDDFADCIAAASYEALKHKEYQRLARSRSVYTGQYLR